MESFSGAIPDNSGLRTPLAYAPRQATQCTFGNAYRSTSTMYNEGTYLSTQPHRPFPRHLKTPRKVVVRATIYLEVHVIVLFNDKERRRELRQQSDEPMTLDSR